MTYSCSSPILGLSALDGWDRPPRRSLSKAGKHHYIFAISVKKWLFTQGDALYSITFILVPRLCLGMHTWRLRLPNRVGNKCFLEEAEPPTLHSQAGAWERVSQKVVVQPRR